MFSIIPNTVSQRHALSGLALAGREIDLSGIPQACADLRRVVGGLLRKARTGAPIDLAEPTWLGGIQLSQSHLVALCGAVSYAENDSSEIGLLLTHIRRAVEALLGVNASAAPVA